MDKERNLLFGVFGVQLRQFSAQQLMDVAAAWVTDPSRDIPTRMLEAGMLTPRGCEILVGLVDQAIKAHDGDANKTLNTFGGSLRIHEVFQDSILGSVSPTEPTILGDNAPERRSSMPPVSAVEEWPGRYTHISEHGRGGFGRVLLVHDLHLNRDIALKELIPELIKDLSSVQSKEPGVPTQAMEVITRFLQEARITSQLEHPSIVPVYELGRHADGSLYYTMRFVRGMTMSDWLRQAGSLTKRIELLPHFVDLCNAIAYAHARGVIHRDLKPSNVMVGNFGETVVLDWGLAKATQHKDEYADHLAETIRAFRYNDDIEPAHTAYGKAMGTPAYMPPEQVRGHLDMINEKSDIYSLGAVLYEILTGDLPYRGRSPREVLEKVVSGPPKPIREHEPHAPPELIAICERAMQADQDLRYATAKDLAEEVRRFQLGALVEAYRYTPLQHTVRFAKRHKAVLTTAAAFLLVLAAVGIFSYASVVRQRNIAVAARAETEQRLYYSDILLARNWIGQKRYDLADVALAEAPKPLRNWEWGYYHRVCHQDLMTITGHTRGVEHISLSPGGKHLVTASEDGSARIVDIDSGQSLRTLRGHAELEMNATFSVDGKYVLTTSDDGKSILWDAQTGALHAALHEHEGGVWMGTFNPDGSRVATTGPDGIIRISDTTTGRDLHALTGHNKSVQCIAYSNDGLTLFSASADGTVGVWDVTTGTLTSRLQPTGGAVQFLAIAPKSEAIATLTQNNDLCFWSNKSYSLLHRIETGNDRIDHVRFSADGKLVVAGDSRGTVRVWECATGELVNAIPAHNGFVFDARFDEGSTKIVSSSNDGTARIWDTISGEELGVLEGHSGPVYEACFIPGRKRIATCSGDSTVKIWDTEEPAHAAVRVRAAHHGAVEGIVYSPNGRALVSYARDHSVILWNLDSFENHVELSISGNFVCGATWSEDSSHVSIVTRDGKVTVIDAKSGARFAQWACGSEPLTAVQISSDGSRVVTASATGRVCLWNVANGKLMGEFLNGDSRVDVVTFDSKRQVVFAGDARGAVTFWRDGGEPQIIVKSAGTPVRCIHCDLLSSRVAIGFEDGSVGVLSLDHSDMRVLKGHRAAISDLVFARNSERVASASEDGTARIWDTATGNELEVLRGHVGPVWCVSFSPDETRVLTASEDGTARIWDGVMGKELCLLSRDKSPVLTAKFSFDGASIATGTADGKVRLWATDVPGLDTNG